MLFPSLLQPAGHIVTLTHTGISQYIPHPMVSPQQQPQSTTHSVLSDRALQLAFFHSEVPTSLMELELSSSSNGLHILSPRTRLLISAVTKTQIPKLLASNKSNIHAGVGIPAYAMNSTNASTPDLVTPARAPSCSARAVSSAPLMWIAVATAAGPAAPFAAMSRAARAKNVLTLWVGVLLDGGVWGWGVVVGRELTVYCG